METEDLSGKRGVVTGGTRGIGRFIAEALLAAGAEVHISGRDQRAVRAAAGELGPRCRGTVCEQRDPKAIERFASKVLESGPPDILVNNAGMWRFAPVVDLSLEHWQETIETNLTGVFLTTKAFLPAMIAGNRGDIFMISSMSGKKGDPGSAAYSASKFGLQGLSQALQYEVREYNIRVMVLNPSSVDKDPADDRPHGRGLHLHARDIASTVVHLACLPGRTLVRDMDIWGTNP